MTKAAMYEANDADNGDEMDPETTGKLTDWKDAEIIETKTEVPPPHLKYLRVRVTRMKS